MGVERNPASAASPTRIDWTAIDHVLLDMDGTLLDLNYDNLIWNEMVPLRLTQRTLKVAEPTAEQIRAVSEDLLAEMLDRRGMLEFYDLHYWGERVAMDMVALHHEFACHILFRPGAETFLKALANSAKRVVLATNAHRDCLGIKHRQLGLLDYFDLVVSSHDYGAPKEDQRFWHRLQQTHPFEPLRTLFIDDNAQVLAAAEQFGIGHLLCIEQPDLCHPPQQTGAFSSVNVLSDLLPLPAEPCL